MRAEYLLLRKTQLNCFLHINPELEIVYVQKGELFLQDGAKTIPIHAGEAALILPYRLHGFSCEEEKTEATVFMFSYPVAEDFHNTYKMQSLKHPTFFVDETLAGFLKYSLEQFKNREEACIIKSIFYALVSAYLRNNQPAEEGGRCPSIPIQEALEYIFFHLDEELTLQETAIALGINKNILGNLFRDRLGISFGDFVSNVRIERAKALLKKSNMTITEIAYECGFGCVRSFNRACLKYMGCTPNDYRKQ